MSDPHPSCLVPSHLPFLSTYFQPLCILVVGRVGGRFSMLFTHLSNLNSILLMGLCHIFGSCCATCPTEHQRSRVQSPTTIETHALNSPHLDRRNNNTFGNWRDGITAEAYIVEAWGEGFMLGALLIMSVITIANMRRRVLLHKLIFLELVLAMSHGTFCFMAFKGYGWYLSSTATLLYCSYFTHNVVAWMKIAPFYTGPQASFGPKVCRWVSWVYLITLAMTVPVIIFEMFNNFRFFNNISRLYERARPYEPLMRDPWWVFSCLTLFHEIQKCYSLSVFRLLVKAPRFGILLAAICMAIAFTIMDILANFIPSLSVPDGINPYWKLALVFKCLTDNIILDNFKSVLQRLRAMEGTTTIQENTMNMSLKEASLGNRVEGEDARALSWPGITERKHSLSGKELEDGGLLNNFGRGRRKQPMAASGQGRQGLVVHRLPHLPSSQSSSRNEEQRNMKRSQTIPNMSGSDYHDDRPPWEHLDFITAPSDPEIKPGGRHVSDSRR